MPQIDNILHKIGGAQVLSTLDLMKGYWQIPMTPSDKQKITFSAPSRFYQFKKNSFGTERSSSLFPEGNGESPKGRTRLNCGLY